MNTLKIAEIVPNPENPRTITKEKFRKLVKSIKEFPEMLEARPIVVDPNNMILGGNMRYKAAKEAGLQEVPIYMATWEEAKAKEFIVKDNVGFGEWDWDVLANEWNTDELIKWGLDVPEETDEDNPYTRKIEAPQYEPTKVVAPKTEELVNEHKANTLIDEIAIADIPKEAKEFLTKAAYRHLVFDYTEIAEYYAHAPKDVQLLMEKSALVIIDFEKAIDNGYVQLTEEIRKLFTDEYGR